MSLDELRSQLDTIDDQMMTLLSQRAALIIQVAELKKHHDIPVHLFRSAIEELVEPNGDKIRILLSNIRLNGAVPDSRFEVELPDDVEKVRG
jgi:outer membrane lipoprotein-sorting protein